MAVPSYANKKLKGYVTLLSVILLTVFGTVVAVTTLSIATDNVSAANTISRSKQAKALADSCMEIAINTLKDDLNYAGNQSFNIGGGSCTINPISGSGNTNRGISVTGTFSGITRRASVTILTVNPLTNFNNWQEN